jgi:hypothetical protein
MPIVYRLETEEGRGPYESGAVARVNSIAQQHGRHLYDDMPPGMYLAPKDDEFFGFATIKQYEEWTAHEEVRKAFAGTIEGYYKPVKLRFAVYDAPSVRRGFKQAVFKKREAKLIEARSPDAPRKRTKQQERIAA